MRFINFRDTLYSKCLQLFKIFISLQPQPDQILIFCMLQVENNPFI